MKELEKIMKAFANSRRLTIVHFLKKENEATVRCIAKEINLSFRATSRHLRKLAACNILEKEQRKTEVFYRITRNPSFAMSQIISTI
jgi:DNA-binding transcriptional ArsR family regulator